MSFTPVSPQIDFAKQEEAILQNWQKNNIFEKSIANRDSAKSFHFYDGPPFATGLPHYGHLLASVLKDIIPRYQTMKGCQVKRRFGWDCHGLPIEYEIDKKLGKSGPQAVHEMGLKAYNAECKSIVLTYTQEWEKTINRIGRWVDFKNDYKTMDLGFMESVWWCIQQLWKKGLIYKGYSVMPYSTAVTTPLSNFEASNNYQEAQDPAITVLFKADGEDNTFYLAWTTTPWTLPSNLALSVGPNITYVKIHSHEHNKHFILSQNQLTSYFKNQETYTIIDTFLGSTLENKTYTPLFNYFSDHKNQGAFRILVGQHVTDTDGTGIVHTAPAFGEDDFNICKQYKIELVMPIDDEGRFTKDVPDFAGQHVKTEADKNIIAKVKAMGHLLRHDTITHNVPFCWRSDTPLIYKAVSAWFMNIEKIKPDLIKNNQTTNWVPENLKNGRFGKWLENARDWNISRNRFWGNPLPIWFNKETDHYLCVGSVAELEKLSEQKITDLHKEFVDEIIIKTKNVQGHENDPGEYKRIPEVLDCWFESGSMPFAQNHFPFEKKDTPNNAPHDWPADFIAEGLDQTRGWFYSLSVIGTALFGTAPFKNVVVNGMILAEDGKKMSKRLKNYPDPQLILDTYGADSLRLCLINSPAVRAEELRFSEASVKDITRRVLLKLWNAYSFFISYATIDNWQPETEQRTPSDNILDKWILSRLQTLLKTVEVEMNSYRLYTVVPALLDFIEDLTNTYIRFNRKRFWGDDNITDKNHAYHTLYSVLLTFTKAMAPFTPFLAESLYQNLSLGRSKESVHLEDYPLATTENINTNLETAVSRMQRIVLMVRNLREQKNIKVKIPLKRLVVIHRDALLLQEILLLENYLKEELNVREVLIATNEDDYVELTAKANGAVLGKRLGKKFQAVSKVIQNLTSQEIAQIELGTPFTFEDEVIGSDELHIYRKAKIGHENVVSDAFITVELDVSLDEDQILEGLAREVVNRIQKLRKDSQLKLDDRIHVEFNAQGQIAQAIEKNRSYIQDQTLALSLEHTTSPQGLFSEVFDIDSMSITVALRVANS